MLDDPLVAGRIEEVIRQERVNAEWAAQLILDELSSVFDDLEDDYFRARRSDVYDVIGRLMRNLAGAPHRSLEKVERKYILLSDDVRPSDTARLDWEHMAGLAMEAGSRTYHTAIIARSLGIPCVVGVRDLTAKVDHGAPLILDGGRGHRGSEPRSSDPPRLPRAQAAAEASEAEARASPGAARRNEGRLSHRAPGERGVSRGVRDRPELRAPRGSASSAPNGSSPGTAVSSRARRSSTASIAAWPSR